MSGRLDGRVALVTGAASGIGAACAERLAAEGALVAGLDLSEPDGVKLAVAADVRDEAGVADAVQRVVEALGAVEILVNAAGVSGGAPVHMLDEAEWDRVVDINLKGTYLVSKHVIAKGMLAAHRGSIIHLASIEGVQAMDAISAYNASKGGVLMLTRQMAVDYGRVGIRVNCLCPGFIETPMTEGIRSDGAAVFRDRIRDAHLMGRFGAATEVAAAAAFLASDDASFITGHPLVVDGGFTAGHRFGLTDLLGL